VRAVVAHGPGALSLESVPDPSPAVDGAIIEVGGCGICGTDLHLLAGDLGSDRFPLVPGHEPWGRVVEVGREAAGVRVGDLVAVDPSLHCGQCGPCRRGHGNMCERWSAIGANRPGAWADYVAAPAANLHPLPEGMPTSVAPLVEPVACAVRGLERLAPEADRPAIVYGAGTMGLVLSLLLQARGVGPVTIVDPNPARRAAAARITGLPTVDVAEAAELRAPSVVEATGNPAAFEQALASVDRAGTLLVFGVASPAARATVSPHRLYADEITIVGSMAILRSFAPAVDAVARHADALAPVVTDLVSLEDVSAGLAAVADGSAVKVVVSPGVRA
jgi:2-desacetyl-2-hydroxyethyl bacteriochlorophyllide A dehydrogenase